MTARGTQLSATADWQISDLIELLSTRGDAALSLPCPGREKLGDGSVAAVARHTADTYHRIAAFMHGRGDSGPHGEAGHDLSWRTENIELRQLLDKLRAARRALSLLAELTDEQLDSIPPAGSARFCDGQRPLEEVVTSMLKHQRHQIDAVKAATA